jgi:HlyD family secretion protein
VRAGDLIAQLDTVELQHDVALNLAEVAAARAELTEKEAGYRSEEIAQTRAALKRAEAALEEATSDYQRQQALYRDKVISARELERFAANFEMAQAQRNEARARYNLHRKGFRQEQVDLVKARSERAEEALEKARSRLGFATLKSPIDGFVLSDNIEAGEYVAAGTPVVTLGDLKHPWLRAYVDETDLGRVHLGQKASISTDTYPDKHYAGRVTFIASEAEFTPKHVQTDKQRTKLVYRVKIEVENPALELKPGMPADATIDLQGGRE